MPLFDDLKGIQKERDVQERKATTLEQLLQREKEAVTEFAGKFADKSWKEIKSGIYVPLYRSLREIEPFTAADLQSLVLAKANNNYDKNEAQALGLYTGVLLHLLTERAHKKRRTANIEIDLYENSFSYLFYYAERADTVRVKNVVGTDTCAFMGSYKGQVGTIVISENKGDWAAEWAGSYKGQVGTIVISKNKGDGAAEWAGRDGGQVGTIVISGNKGANAAHRAGSDNGQVGTIVISENKGDWAAHGAGSYAGKVGTIVISENKGDWVAYWAGSDGGKVGTIVISKNEGNGATELVGSDGGRIDTLALYKAGTNPGINATAHKIITGREALELYNQIMQREELRKYHTPG
ncbi:hypothetical protein HYX14_02345 [Candidatus Woesearchaeota archaeon]|nr:hypothetical protein [Candidatus Woesearchaeota archaeon]